MKKVKKEKKEVHVKAGRRSKAKGSNNERMLAKEFRDWWGWGEWARTPASGGWATPEHREAFRTCGDVMTTATDFPFCLEAKKQENWRLEQVLSDDSKCKIFEWWEQACLETPKGLVPLLIFARNFVDQLVMFSLGWFQVAFKQHAKEGDPCFEWQLYQHLVLDFGMLAAVDRPETLCIMPLASFLKINPASFGRKEENVQRANESGSTTANGQTEST